MAIAVTCSGCDRTMKVKDEFAGRRALCPFCKCEVQVPEQGSPHVAEANEYSLAPQEPDARDDRDDEPRRRPRLRNDDEDARPRRSGMSGGVVSGLLMMLGAVVWFFGAWALGAIFFYPPILFIIGLVTFIKGLAGNEE